MILMLISPEERDVLDKEIMKEPVLIYSSADILSKLYGEIYDSIIVTRRFSNLVGNDNLINAIKALNLKLPLGELDVTYLNHHDTEDDTSRQLYKIGCKIIRTDIKYMDLELFYNLKYTKSSTVTNIKDDEVLQNLLEIIQEVESKDDEALRLYANVNYKKIVNTILNAKGIIDNVKAIKDDNSNLSNELQNALDAEVSTTTQLIELKYLYNECRAKYRELLKYMTAYKESIDEYNSKITTTSVGDEYMVEVNNENCLVLYFKEIEDINFLRFYNSIINCLTNIKKYNTKSIILENTNRTYYNPYKDYDVLSSLSTTAEVVQSDKILRYGNASKIIELLTRKQFLVQVLIILDRTGNDSLAVSAPNQFVYYLGKRRENYPILNIQDENFISPCEGLWTDVDILLSKAEKLKQIPFDIHANRHPLMQNILKLVENNVVVKY